MRRIALFLSSDACRAGAPLDVGGLAEHYAGTLQVVHVVEDFHKPGSMMEILELVRRNRIESVVLAGRSPDYYDSTLGADYLADRLVKGGINPNLVIFANLSEHCSMVSEGYGPAPLHRKAIMLIDVALLDARIRNPVDTTEVPPRQRVLVIGSGEAAAVAAYRLVGRGFRVVVASESEGWEWPDAYRAHLEPGVAALQLHDECRMIFSAGIRSVAGWAGDYEVVFVSDGEERVERFGGIVVAVGSDYERYAPLWPLLQIDSDANKRPLSRNRHTLAVRSAAEGVAIVRPPGSSDRSRSNLRQQTINAAAAVLEISNLLSEPWLDHANAVSKVDAADCGLCRTCIKVCAFHACSIDEEAETSKVEERLCKACGNCVVACPAGARDLIGGPTRFITEAIDLMAGRRMNREDPNVLAFLCAGCAYRAADSAARKGQKIPIGVMPLRVQCGGRVDMQHVLQAFQGGFDGVIIGTCREGTCHNIVGHLYLDRRVVLFRDLLRSRGFDPEHLQIMDISPHEGELCATVMREFVDGLRNRDRSPVEDGVPVPEETDPEAPYGDAAAGGF